MSHTGRHSQQLLGQLTQHWSIERRLGDDACQHPVLEGTPQHEPQEETSQDNCDSNNNNNNYYYYNYNYNYNNYYYYIPSHQYFW